MTASDIATKVAQRAGLTVGQVDADDAPSSSTSPRPDTTDWEFLDAAGRRDRLRGGRAGRQVQLHAAGQAAAAPAASSESGSRPAGARAGHGPAALPRRPDLGRAGQGGRGPRLGRRQQAGARPRPHRRRPRSAELPTATPAELARPFGDPIYVATDVPYRTQAEVDAAAAALAERDRRRLRRVRRRGPGQPGSCGPAPRSRIDRLGAPFDGKYTRHHLPAPLRPGRPATPRRSRSPAARTAPCSGLTGGGGAGRPAARGGGRRWSSDVNDPQKSGRVR